jgi:hypothetical protein
VVLPEWNIGEGNIAAQVNRADCILVGELISAIMYCGGALQRSTMSRKSVSLGGGRFAPAVVLYPVL